MKPGRARAVVDYLCESYRISIRRACRAYPLDRSTYHYRSRRPDRAPPRQRIREITKTRVRYRYQRVHVLLRREGWAINDKRTRRLYREEGLQLRNKNPKRKVAAKLREDRAMAIVPNECWAMDFMIDQLLDGRKLRVLTIVDICTTPCPAIGVGHAYMALMSSPRWKPPPVSMADRNASGSTTGPNLCLGISTMGGSMASCGGKLDFLAPDGPTMGQGTIQLGTQFLIGGKKGRRSSALRTVAHCRSEGNVAT